MNTSQIEPAQKIKTHLTIPTVLITVGVVLFGLTAFLLLRTVRTDDNSPPGGITEPPVTEQQLSALELANGLRRIQPGETAVLRQPGQVTAAQAPARKVALGNGTTVDIPAGTPGAVVLQGSDSIANYVRVDSGTTMINGQLASPRTLGGVDQQLEQDLAAQPRKTVPVIIELKVKHQPLQANASASDRSTARQEFQTAKGKVAQTIGAGHGRVKQDLKIIAGLSADLNYQGLKALKNSGLIERISPDQTVKADLDVSVQQIRADEAWTSLDVGNNALMGKGERIAIIDTGVDYRHPDLGGCFGSTCKVAAGYDFVNADGDPMDDHGHGTHVASTAAGNGVLRGTAPEATIYAYKVLNAGGSGSASSIVAAIDRTADPNSDGDPSDRVDVASMSLGGSGNPDDPMSLAVDRATALGVVFTVAAGNNWGYATIASPGTARSAITVAASCKIADISIDPYCQTPIAAFSSKGPLLWNGVDLQKPDIAAPGRKICAAKAGTIRFSAATCLDDAHVVLSGTSMATPHMAGVVALLRQAHPEYTSTDVKRELKAAVRSLGQTYAQQGAGEIVAAAMPLRRRVLVDLWKWRFETNPAVALSSNSQQFTVTATDATLDQLILTMPTLPSGISVRADKTSISVPTKGTDFFTVTVDVDNNMVRSGMYRGDITLRSGTVLAGIIPLEVVVTPTLVAVPAKGTPLDYGLDQPTLSNWTSSSQLLTITNRRIDQTQTVITSSTGFVSGIQLSATPSSLTIAPGATVTIDTKLIVNNTIVSNAVYQGTIAVSGPTTALTWPAKFTKFFVLEISDPQFVPATGRSVFLYVHDRSRLGFFQYVSQLPVTVYLPTAAPVDVYAQYFDFSTPDANGMYPYYRVFKEGISVASGRTSLVIAKTMATYAIEHQGLSYDGVQVTNVNQINQLDYPANSQIGLFSMQFAGRTNFSTGFSSAYRYKEMFMAEDQPARSLSVSSFSTTGLTGAKFIRSQSSDYRTYEIPATDDRVRGESNDTVFLCPGGAFCAAYSWLNRTLSLPVQQSLHTIATTGDITSAYQVSNVTRLGCTQSGPCPYAFQSPSIELSSGRRKVTQWQTNYLPDATDQYTYTGLGPDLWLGRITAAGSTAWLQSASTATYIPSPTLRQDYALGDHSQIPYQLKRGGVIVSQGILPEFTPSFGGYAFLYPLATFAGLVNGAYDFSSDYTTTVGGLPAAQSLRWHFTMGQSDPTPPALTSFKFFTDGKRSQSYDATLVNTLTATVDPIGGTLSRLEVQLSTDNVTFQSVATSTTVLLSANLPSIPGTGHVYLRLIATDAGNNTLTYTISLPRIDEIIPPDNTPPQVSFTQPTPNQVFTGDQVHISLNATDDVGVTSVDVLLNSNLLTSLTGPRFETDWDVSTMAGTFTLEAIAYDAVGHSARTLPLTVYVDHGMPTVQFIGPRVGTRLFGTASLESLATDDTSIQTVQYYMQLPGRTTYTLLGEATACTMVNGQCIYQYIWDTRTAHNGAAYLYAAAIDLAGRSILSPKKRVEITNSVFSSPTEPIIITEPTSPGQFSE